MQLWPELPWTAASTNTRWTYLFHLVSGWDVCREISFYNGQIGYNLCGIVSMSSWRCSECSKGYTTSESVVLRFHLVCWMPLLFRGGVCLLFVRLVCFAFPVEDIQSFAFSPVLSQLENSWPTTDVLMTVRASSARHGLQNAPDTLFDFVPFRSDLQDGGLVAFCVPC